MEKDRCPVVLFCSEKNKQTKTLAAVVAEKVSELGFFLIPLTIYASVCLPPPTTTPPHSLIDTKSSERWWGGCKWRRGQWGDSSADPDRRGHYARRRQGWGSWKKAPPLMKWVTTWMLNVCRRQWEREKCLRYEPYLCPRPPFYTMEESGRSRPLDTKRLCEKSARMTAQWN